MRTAALAIFLVAFSAANAQRLSLLPQLGFESSKTKINYNDLNCFAPLGAKFSPQAALQLNYASKKGHGFFVGAATSRSTVVYAFTDPENALTSYTAGAGNTQVRLEGGYMYTSKPILFNKSKAAAVKSESVEKKKCGYYASRCQKPSQAKKKEMGSWMRIQPSIGMGYIPGVRASLVDAGNAAGYEYRAGNWNTALVTGAGFEFGRNNDRWFTVSINYFKGLGNLNTQTLTTEAASKTTTTTFSSAASGWNMRVGVPFTLWAKKPAAKPKTVEKAPAPQKSRCGAYKPAYRCGRII